MNQISHKKHLLAPLLLLLAACSPGSTPSQTSSNPISSGILVQTLTPICASTLRDRNVIPSQARGFGIDETAVCECGLRKVQDKVAANPAILIDVLRNTDTQVSLLVSVGAECSQELLTRALTGQPYPSPTPSSYYPYPTPTPSYNPNYNPIPTAPPANSVPTAPPFGNPVPTPTPVGPY